MRNWINLINEATGENVFWHGSPSGELRGAHYGLHLGTQEAARQALEAKIGMRADGKDWDGTLEYGKTLLAGRATQQRFKETGHRKSVFSGYNCGTRDCQIPEDDFYPTDWSNRASYSDHNEVPFGVRPELAEYELVGPMTNNQWYPHDDWKANGYMKAQVKKGNAKRGYFYRNEGEDAGSISIVVPNGGGHLRKIAEGSMRMHEGIGDFGTTPTLFHGTNVDNLWLIMKAGKLTSNWHGRDYAGPNGVCLSRSYDVAVSHSDSWTENLEDSFFGYFGLGPAPEMDAVVLEFDRSKIKQQIIPYDDFSDSDGNHDSEQEERVVGDLPLDSLVRIHVNPRDLETFLRYAVDAHKSGGSEYDVQFREIIQKVLKDPRLVNGRVVRR